MKFKLSFAGLSDTGLVRTANQDSYYIDPDGRFFIVADGMGGHAAGQEASRIAAETIQSYLLERWDSAQSSESLLEGAFLAANQAILDDQLQNPARADMGTTAVAIAFRPNPSTEGENSKVTCANLGDSRIYRLRGDEFQQITEDDTLVARAVQMGSLSPDEVRTYPYRHVLLQCLGREDVGDVEIQEVHAQPGDRLLLCSDGLTEELTDDAISSHLQSTSDSEEAASALVAAAKEKGGHDNITVVLVSVDDKDGE